MNKTGVEKLTELNESWSMFVVTREAFVVEACHCLDDDSSRILYKICLGIPNTSKIDENICRKNIDAKFAHFVIDEALKLLASGVIEIL